MKKIQLILQFLITICPVYAVADELILYENKIGSFILEKNADISLLKLQSLFSDYSVLHSIESGDSPDFHLFKIYNNKNELLFTMRSFISNTINSNTDYIPLHTLELHSPLIKDQYGISIGMTIDVMLKLREEDFAFSANHHDNSLGKNNIWYSFSVNGEDTDYISPTEVTKEQAVNSKSIIHSISWPGPRW